MIYEFRKRSFPAFFAMYEKQTDRPELVLVRRAPTADPELHLERQRGI